MSELELQKLELIVYLFKWLMGVFGLCIPIVLGFFISIRKDLNKVDKNHAVTEKTLTDLKQSHTHLENFVYNRN